MENKDFYFNVAKTLYKTMDGRDWYFKASFDKANRTSLYGGRGPGMEEGIEAFKAVKKEFPNIKLLTDIHETSQVEKLAEYIDCIQIPAFLCRQTDLIVECARHFNKVNIKKGQWLGPDNIIKSLDKIKHTNPDCEAWLCERGSNFGYDKMIVDFTIVDEIRKHFDKFIFDCTHSTQRSREIYTYQGDPILAERFAVASSIFKYDGVFMEMHPRPKEAVSDADCQIPLGRLNTILKTHDNVEKAIRGFQT
jgi:2-dehydro-3-deoxyphosphooctonate aldolase (KDO 8-P synthase)